FLYAGALDERGGKHWYEANDRTDAQRRSPLCESPGIIVEAILLIPESAAVGLVDGMRDRAEMLEEFRGDILVDPIVARQFQCHREHVDTVERHPRGAVHLLELS